MTAEIDAEIVSRSAPAFDLVGRTLRRYAIFIILAALIVFFHFAEPAFLRVGLHGVPHEVRQAGKLIAGEGERKGLLIGEDVLAELGAERR